MNPQNPHPSPSDENERPLCDDQTPQKYIPIPVMDIPSDVMEMTLNDRYEWVVLLLANAEITRGDSR